ncbi:post-GPI attachment to proteins factor 6-like isoform X2 [Tubulanus polymorphus]|uniref:post-GPI attachment to proteins factor 6-like isoform X2 n=1 Tax=Tubulanus polymorphus TaxID=672921 RepID=UPI003DA48E4A
MAKCHKILGLYGQLYLHKALIIYFLISTHTVFVPGYVIEHSHDGLVVSTYKNYGSVAVASYIIPEQTQSSRWLFMAFSISECSNPATVNIYLHAHGYPVISPKNESFPENFMLTHKNNYKIPLNTNDHPIAFGVFNPTPGRWFSAAFVEESNTAIKQKGLHTKCRYAYSARHIVFTREDINEILVVNNQNFTHQAELTNQSVQIYFKYQLPQFTYRYTVNITDCESSDVSNGSCPIVIITNGAALPSTYTSLVTNCIQKPGPCVHEEAQPVPLQWNYLYFNLVEGSGVNFKFQITYKECTEIKYKDSDSAKIQIQTEDAGYNRTINSTNRSNVDSPSMVNLNIKQWNTTNTTILKNAETDKVSERGKMVSYEPVVVDPDATCIGSVDIDTVRSSGRFYRYYMLLPAVMNTISLQNWTAVYGFKLDEMLDMGGTLKFQAKRKDKDEKRKNISIEFCLQQKYVPVSDDGILCGSRQIWLHPENDSVTDYIPYPEYGLWYLAARRHCTEGNETDCTENSTEVQIILSSHPCVEGECGKHGRCTYFNSYLYHFSSCKCDSGWRGYTCGDGKYAKSEAQMIATVLLLTLSNLFFLPAIVIAIKRAFYVEAIVYFFNMFFSSFYHACDQDYGYYLCIMPYDILSFCDFLGSISSFWVTILCMAKLQPVLRSSFHTFGILLIAMGVYWDRHGIWIFLVPVITAVLIMITSWGVRMYRSKSLFPSKKRYLFHILPGICLAGIGLVLFAFVETDDNYFYVHSIWHVLLSTSIIFLLPSKRRQSASLNDDRSLLASTYCMASTNDERGTDNSSMRPRMVSADQPLVDFME